MLKKYMLISFLVFLTVSCRNKDGFVKSTLWNDVVGQYQYHYFYQQGRNGESNWILVITNKNLNCYFDTLNFLTLMIPNNDDALLIIQGKKRVSYLGADSGTYRLNKSRIFYVEPTLMCKQFNCESISGYSQIHNKGFNSEEDLIKFIQKTSLSLKKNQVHFMQAGRPLMGSGPHKMKRINN